MDGNKRFQDTEQIQNAPQSTLTITNNDKPLNDIFLEKILYLYTFLTKNDINQGGIGKPKSFTKKIKMLFINIFAYNIAVYLFKYGQRTNFNRNRSDEDMKVIF